MVYSKGRLNISPPATPRPYSCSDSVIVRVFVFEDPPLDINRYRDVLQRKLSRALPTLVIFRGIELKDNGCCDIEHTKVEPETKAR